MDIKELVIIAASNDCSKITSNHVICIADEPIQGLHNELQPITRQTTKKRKQKLNLSQSKDAAGLTAVRISFRGRHAL